MVGFVVLLLLAGRLFGKALAGSAQPAGTPGRYLGIAAVGSLTAIALHSLVDFNLYIPANAMLLAWIAGVAEGLEFTDSRPRRRRRAPRGPTYLESSAQPVP